MWYNKIKQSTIMQFSKIIYYNMLCNTIIILMIEFDFYSDMRC